MAAILERTSTDDITDALSTLADAERFLADARAQLVAALAADDADRPGILLGARRAVSIVGGCAINAGRFVREGVNRAA